MALIDCLRNLGLAYRSVRAQDQQFLEHSSVLGKYSQRWSSCIALLWPAEPCGVGSVLSLPCPFLMLLEG